MAETPFFYLQVEPLVSPHSEHWGMSLYLTNGWLVERPPIITQIQLEEECTLEKGAWWKELRDSLGWSRVLLIPFISGVVVSFEVASFSLGRSSESHQHRRKCHPQPPWGSSRRGHSRSQALLRPGCAREEEERNMLTHAFGHFQIIRNFLNQGLHTHLFFSWIREIMRPFSKYEGKKNSQPWKF